MRTLNFWVLVVLGLIFASCDDDDHLGDWEKSVEFGGAPREAAVCFTDPSTGTVEEDDPSGVLEPYRRYHHVYSAERGGDSQDRILAVEQREEDVGYERCRLGLHERGRGLYRRQGLRSSIRCPSGKTCHSEVCLERVVKGFAGWNGRP